MTTFLDRAEELARLERFWASGRAEFVVLTGRRRVGKSRLLEEFFRDKLLLSVVGTAQTRRVQLADVTR
jgi:AAA+ ATPase superfamily predicted ATPase